MMTLAEHKADSPPPRSPRASTRRWWPFHGSAAPLAQPEAGAKPQEDVADLLRMSALDQKAPPVAPGSDALLQAIVKDHLQKAYEPAPQAKAEPALAPPPPDEVPAPDPSLSEEQRVAMLQREIATLLQDTTGHAPPRPSPSDLHTVAVADAGTLGGGMKVTPEELNVLLNDAPEAIDDSPTTRTAIVTELPAPARDDASAKLEEAEGVLREELAQLMAETPAAPASEQAAAPVMKPEPPAKLEPAPQVVVAAAPVAPSETPAVAALGAVMAPPAPPPGVPEHPIIELAEHPAHTGVLGRMWQLLSDVVMMPAQLLDVPFSWINEIDKNIIGFAAFLLLLSGIMLYVISFFTNTR